MCSCKLTQFGETIAATLGLEVCSFSLHTERNMGKPFKAVVKIVGASLSAILAA